MSIDITKMTSKGQVVIPQEIREEISIKEGEKFLVYTIDEGIILKRVGTIAEGKKTVDRFEKTFQSLWKTARQQKLTKKDIAEEIAIYRKEKHAQNNR